MKIALAPINPTVGDLAGNAELIAQASERHATADLVVFPELCLCGYPPRDLLLHESFIAACENEIDRLADRLRGGPAVVIGAPLKHPGRAASVTNSLVVLGGGKRVARYDKRLLPTYDVFDEWRYFVPGREPMNFDVAGTRVGLSICEDLWGGIDAGTQSRYADDADPIADLAAAGANVILNPSASPFVVGKHDRHREIIAAQARRHGIPVLSVNQLGANDDLVFDGAAIATRPDGASVESRRWTGEPIIFDTDKATPGTTTANADAIADCCEALTLGVRDYAHKCGFTSACLGLSGGIDSAVTAAIAVRALGAKRVTGVMMPGKYSSTHSIEDARDLSARLGCDISEAPITEPFEGFRQRLDRLFAFIGRRPLGRELPDLTEENLQSRIRGTLMMAVSNRTGAMLLTTGNKSELAVGYGTLYGDMNGGLAVISDLYKREVYDLARHLNANHAKLGFDSPPIPESTITKPPSAELAPDQKDEDSLPPYHVLDEIVRRRVELRESREQIERATGFDREQIDEACRLIGINEYKRFQLAIGLKLRPVSFGPGRRMPLAARSPI